ncbi:MAG: radical SAM protein [Nitrososphaeria archaeon]|nr:radical SAM protein [Nitrososphaeria archaeon]
MLRKIVVIDESSCVKCNFCREVNVCKSPGKCIGCLSCYYACPYQARRMIDDEVEDEIVKIVVDGVECEVPRRLSVKEALERFWPSSSGLDLRGLTAPCNLGGCWACAVVIDGKLERSCVNHVRDGMRISLNLEGIEPLRIVHGPQPHKVGGKATPWYEVNGYRYVESAIWVAGCNLRCPQCQNYHVTYDNSTKPMTPKEAAEKLTGCKRVYDTPGIAVSGGEPTLNRKWLIELFRFLREMNPGARLHLDSNGTILTEDYVDELVEAGCNNIGIEPKAGRLSTYMRITGIRDKDLAEKYFNNAWNTVKYIVDNYLEKVYLGMGFAYNSDWMSFEEVAEIGEKVASIDPRIQVTVLDYFPAFRRRDLRRPTVSEMFRVKEILEGVGLRTVIVQTRVGHIGPRDKSIHH